MIKKEYLFVFFLCLASFFPYFFTESFAGYDSYYYLSKICEKKNFDVFKLDDELPFSKLVWNFFPCNFFLIKLFMFFVLVLCVFITVKIGELFSEKNGWLAGAFVFLTPLLFRNVIKFENDLFAFVFIFLSTYYFLKYLKHSKDKDLLLSVLFFGGGCGFWAGTVFIAIGFSLLEPIFAGIILLIALLFGHTLLPYALGSSGVIENNPQLAITNIIFFLPASITLQKTILPLTIFFVGFGLVNPKFFLLAIPFLCINLLKFVEKHPKTKNVLLIVALIFSLYFGFSTFDYPPTKNEWLAVNQTIKIAKQNNLKIYNDWGLGYNFYWLETVPFKYGRGTNNYNCNKGVYLTWTDQCNQCKLVSSFPDNYNRPDLKILICD